MKMTAQRASVRLFENRFLERLSFASPALILAIWLPVVVAAAAYGISHVTASASMVTLTVGASLLGWTLFEYVMHRFIFHFPASSPGGRWLLFLLHGCHHADPQDKRRNLMPPAVTLLVGAGLLALFVAAAGPAMGAIVFAGFMVGYLAYDLTHYACHQLDMPWMRTLKRRHLAHHFAGQEANFAVTLPLWDRMLGTTLVKPGAGQRQRVDDRQHP